MANKTINQLTAVATVTNADEVEVQKSGETTTKKATVGQLTTVEATARAAQDDVIEASAGLATNGTYPAMTNSWYLRAADFVTGLVDRVGSAANVTANLWNAIRMLDSKLYEIAGTIGDTEFIRTETVVCSTADILSCNAVPKVLLQGISGRRFEILSVFGYNNFNSAAFEAGTDKLEIKYFGGDTMFELSNAFLESGSDLAQRALPTTNVAIPIASVVLYCGTAPTTGDGEITIVLTYRIFDV